jgi:ABC-type branched-subunit amino acid transport system ATPase component/ABC-type branched-subunit amino acid transport system permease subunit
MNVGTLVLGLLNGLAIGLLAVGFVLIYKSNRFLNLAHAQLGTLSSLLLAKAVLDWHFPWLVAFVVFVTAGAVVGFLVERLAVQKLRQRTSSPVALLLLSLGISQLMLGFSFLPGLTPQGHPDYPQPFDSHVRIGGVRLTGMSLLTLILVPILVGGLAAFMRYSIVGKQVRASANNPDAARLCGISVRWISSLTWQIAGVFSAVSAILVAPSQGGGGAQSLGPLLLLLTVGAAAFGAFVSIPLALAGGLLLGLVNQVTLGITSRGADGELAVFITILLIVLVRGKAIGAAFAASGAAIDDPPVLRVPASLGTTVVRSNRIVLGVAGIFLGLVWPQLPYFSSVENIFKISGILVYALVGISLTMLLGWAGQVSLGSFGVTGICAFLTVKWAGDGWPLPALILFAAVTGAAVMVAVGLPALRVRGLTLAVTTLGLAVLGSDYFLLQPALGGSGSQGTSFTHRPSLGGGLGTPTSPQEKYYLALGVLVLAALGASALRRSLPGRLVVAVRDNERASGAFGISPPTVKLAILGMSGAFAGVAGVIFADIQPTITPGFFSANVSIALIAVPVIGGLGSVAGAITAAVLLYGLTSFLAPVAAPLLGNLGNGLALSLFLGGVGQIAVLLQFPTGLAGAAQAVLQRRVDLLGERATLMQARAAEGVPLQISGVRVQFGGLLALDEPDIEVRRGEIVGLIGTNGAGKTTLMNVVSGLIKPSAGSVRVYGHEVVDLPPDFRAAFGLARSFQDATLFAGLTVRETVQLALANQVKIGFLSALTSAPWARAADRRTRAEAELIIERFGLTDFADSRASELSTGTRRICDLAAQVAAKPKVLLLDEPTAGVAQREAERFGPLLRELRDELDCAILIIEHDMPLLMGLCHRVYALETGRVIAEGTPEEVRSNPRVVASYLGTDKSAIHRSGVKGTAQPAPTVGPKATPKSRIKPPPKPQPVVATRAVPTRRAAANRTAATTATSNPLSSTATSTIPPMPTTRERTRRSA